MRALITLVHPSAWSVDVLVDAEPVTPVRDVVKVMLEGLDAAYPSLWPEMIFLDGRQLDLDAPLGGSGIHDGSMLHLHQPGPPPPAIGGLVTLRAVAGTGAGRIWSLGAGEHRLGSAPGSTVGLGPGHPPLVATVAVAVDATVRLRGAAEGVLLDGEPLPGGEGLWRETAQLTVGETLFEAHPVLRPDAMVEPSPDSEYLDYNRPPRLLPPQRPGKYRLPSEPKSPEGNAMPWLAATLPAGFGVVMAVVMRNPLYLMMAAMSPVMVVANWFTGRKQGKRSHRSKVNEYKAQRDKVEAEIDAALELERRDRRAASPDPAELLVIAMGPRARLWERRRTDPDHLVVRVGTADLRSDIAIELEGESAGRRDSRQVTDVPVAFSITQAGVVGVAGRGDWPRRLARWMTGQLAVLQSPRDLQLYVLTDPTGGPLWDWAAWLPHTRPLLGQTTLTLLGTDAETIARRVAELIELIEARRQARLDAGANAVITDPDIVVVFDGARRLRALPGVVNILLAGPAVGVYSICVDNDQRTLPEECTTVVAGGDGLPTTLHQQRAARIEDLRVDDVVDEWFATTGRRLAPIRDVSDNQNESALPASARLLEVLQLEDPSPAALTARWSASGRGTRAVIGYTLDGPFALDLVHHGPHGLVAGTTGSGKSEFLQTLVASLAVANRPDAMNFVLVDYKGGAAFKDCVDLPHTVGMVTDLDTHLVERALTSLGAELTHREHQLAAAGAKDIEDYLDYAERRGGLAPIPRLLIVIDEFASMARELPDFVTGLVNIAQRGRSLGIHLILATQRPSGVVSAEIRANTNLRIALRVTDAGESSDVIDAREAATIAASTPGRGYARLGHSSLLPFQAGRVGGRRPGRKSEATVAAPFLYAVDWQHLGRPVPQRPRGVTETEEATDLSVLVSAIRLANDLMGLPQQRRPWLPALPTNHVVELAEPSTGEPVFAWAVQDLPRSQQQKPVTIDLATFGHLHIAGAPRSGRSQALRTIAAAGASAAGVTDLHLYGLDCGNGALLPMTKLPHCGAVVQRSDTERAVRLLNRLQQEVQRRQRLLGEGGFADLTEQRAASAPEDRLPHVMLLLDRWEGFMGTLSEHDGGALTDLVYTLLREGASAGVHLIITGDHSLLSGRISSLTEEKVVLRLSDRTDASMAGLNPRKIPENLPPGRGYRAVSSVEMQVSLIAADPSGPAQVAAMHALAAQLAEREAAVPRDQRPNRIAVMPTQLTFDQVWAGVGSPAPGWALIGVGGDELEPIGMDLVNDLPTFLIAGPSRSGRSTALGVMAESLLRGGAELVIGAPLRSPLRDLAGRPGVRGVITDENPRDPDFADLLEPGDGPVVLMIDDAESWRDMLARDYVRQLIRTASGSNRAVVIAGEISSVAMGFSGWQVEVKKNRRGILLSPPTLSAGDLVGVRLSRAHLAERVVPGSARAHLGDGSLQSLQIPLLATGEK
ncbi:S-DNA-T family DNA segregation ATPase FtsK/SpoIIIE [Actinoplanes lutulentus]|uniref:S-DNA-T family DNA segregation ATPase FtsK/SpoIIIE n=1 Tax=Actinoplanes lutulentus TaxID=1287878 RepID=A0A327ZCQ1_9ACTN|nr:FtsK/SpoIIIE domain-containing protein [Actinoplanes lutulentus]MBB2948291.1 S-DNA-T family DNA segregation ATPase FtsK/SpoIIIE [Actinoplanes lutulentus]RAK31212.1 S-DNA-T family DNA segregation ATPase FtsK/SpoIIIE [Actinoplanes lutulentus]